MADNRVMAETADHPTAQRIANENFAGYLGTQLVEAGEDRVVVRLPYNENLGTGRVHGGAISALVDIAATAAFWSSSRLPADPRGATVGFSINFLRLAVAVDLEAEAVVRRRGGTLCTGEVTVRQDTGEEVAIATVTYKLSGSR